VSDARRKTDIAWFKSKFNDLKLIRITADEFTRKERGWNFIQGTYIELDLKKNLQSIFFNSLKFSSKIINLILIIYI